jgi:hypothetical protein
MDRTEFNELLEECENATQEYVRQAQRTSLMLGKCTMGSFTFDQRFALMKQEILELQAYRLYLASKSSLYKAALSECEALAAN